MENAQTILLRAGGKDQLLADFTALCETTTMGAEAKYALRPTLENLAKFLTSQSGGPNKDMALFELCHLVCAIGILRGSGELSAFFLQPEKASPQYYRHALQGEVSETVEVGPHGVRLSYDQKTFEVRFGRMPFLGALYEFLCSMDGFAYFTRFNDLFDQMCDQPISDKTIRACSNALASDLRKYRISYLSTAQADGKFIQVYKYLQDQNDAQSSIILQDDHVFDFWRLHNQGKDYRGYRTVFDLFCDFARAFEESRLNEAARRAAPLGVNQDEGEVDISDNERLDGLEEEWTSPFDIFDGEDMGDIRFFKKKTERGPIESLMIYGPDALRLPLAFLRHEIFGQVQAGITNDLQVGRPRASVDKRISCEEVQSYQARLDECQAILGHIKALQASSLHVLNESEPDNLVIFPATAQKTAQDAFAKMKRKGFDEDAFDQRAVFEKAAHALVAMESQLCRYMSTLKERRAPDRFDEDRARFKTQFQTLYQEERT